MSALELSLGADAYREMQRQKTQLAEAMSVDVEKQVLEAIKMCNDYFKKVYKELKAAISQDDESVQENFGKKAIDFLSKPGEIFDDVVERFFVQFIPEPVKGAIRILQGALGAFVAYTGLRYFFSEIAFYTKGTAYTIMRALEGIAVTNYWWNGQMLLAWLIVLFGIWIAVSIFRVSIQKIIQVFAGSYQDKRDKSNNELKRKLATRERERAAADADLKAAYTS